MPREARQTGGPLGESNPGKNRGLEVEIPAWRDLHIRQAGAPGPFCCIRIFVFSTSSRVHQNRRVKGGSSVFSRACEKAPIRARRTGPGAPAGLPSPPWQKGIGASCLICLVAVRPGYLHLGEGPPSRSKKIDELPSSFGCPCCRPPLRMHDIFSFRFGELWSAATSPQKGWSLRACRAKRGRGGPLGEFNPG